VHRETDDLVKCKYRFIGRAHGNRVFKILFVQKSEEEEYHEESALMQVMRNKSAITVCNPLVSNGVVVG